MNSALILSNNSVMPNTSTLPFQTLSAFSGASGAVLRLEFKITAFADEHYFIDRDNGRQVDTWGPADFRWLEVYVSWGDDFNITKNAGSSLIAQHMYWERPVLKVVASIKVPANKYYKIWCKGRNQHNWKKAYRALGKIYKYDHREDYSDDFNVKPEYFEIFNVIRIA
ncbi:hypothetical protein DMB92_05210 [Campylobacter sp. MIT 99-7217]|uniref:hypothetical protein n=1 Tax=Campylobacter sp. MIT 99-7217 TaxID=535091 RepID=UPI001159EC75|nr:hypothetical protein [Campylobacter sp. MIT 99-7217]TQR31788.1 hypothetical protein DMB92_05210 [Campylobacter sp. MIT 99-7217]